MAENQQQNNPVAQAAETENSTEARPSQRIPIIAVTGTNGKTTTTRLVAYILKQAGYRPGFTTSDGIYIHDDLVKQGDCSGPVSAAFVLQNQQIDYAVLECARGGILRAGLAFDECDVAIITNVAEDHLNLEGVNTLQQLAGVKAIVARAVKPGGYAILNADDDLVYAIGKEVNCKIGYFSLDAGSERIAAHCAGGGIAAVVENGYITLLNGAERIPVTLVDAVPITFSGMAGFNIANALAAALATFVQGVSIADISTALQRFVPSAALTPGRMNVFEFRDITVIVDFAHNPHGFRAIRTLITTFPATIKTGIIAGTGDRRDEDIIHLAEEAAGMFDELIIRQDTSLRGRPGPEIIDLVVKGIKNISHSKKITIIERESEAIDFAFKNAGKNSLLFITSDHILNAVAYVQKLKEKEDSQIPGVAD